MQAPKRDPHRAIGRREWRRAYAQSRTEGERKYRYYVSRNFPAQGLVPSRGGWRLPARELEGRVAAAAGEMLDDESAVLEPLRKLRLTPARSTVYSTPREPGVTVFNRKPSRPPRLPSWWIGWNSNLTA